MPASPLVLGKSVGAGDAGLLLLHGTELAATAGKTRTMTDLSTPTQRTVSAFLFSGCHSAQHILVDHTGCFFFQRSFVYVYSAVFATAVCQCAYGRNGGRSTYCIRPLVGGRTRKHLRA